MGAKYSFLVCDIGCTPLCSFQEDCLLDKFTIDMLASKSRCTSYTHVFSL